MQPNTYEALIDDTFKVPMTLEDLSKLDIRPAGEGKWHFLYEGKSFHVDVEETHYAEKMFTLRINGFRHRIALNDPYDVLVDKLGLAKKPVQIAHQIKAPMPGLVRDIMVAPGQAVMVGDPILILEAMKMENIIKSPGDGIVETIPVEVGASVEKGQVLVNFAK
jgi:biotin carboxyl carrier protein